MTLALDGAGAGAGAGSGDGLGPSASSAGIIHAGKSGRCGGAGVAAACTKSSQSNTTSPSCAALTVTCVATTPSHPRKTCSVG